MASEYKVTNWPKIPSSRYVAVDGFNSILGNLENAISAEVEELAAEAANFGADKMSEYISSRGTGNLWERPWGGKAGSFIGRVTTGEMLNSVQARAERGPDQARASFGWLRNVKDYFKYQEEGFYHVLSRIRIEPMFALRDARRDVVAELPRLARKYEKRIAKRVNR
jgi:hypothetical protein